MEACKVLIPKVSYVELKFEFLFPSHSYYQFSPLQAASGIIFPIIKAEGFRQMFFPATVPAYYRAPPAK